LLLDSFEFTEVDHEGFSLSEEDVHELLLVVEVWADREITSWLWQLRLNDWRIDRILHFRENEMMHGQLSGVETIDEYLVTIVDKAGVD
jgi:hypothetical protein